MTFYPSDNDKKVNQNYTPPASTKDVTDVEYINILRTMKPSELIEEIFGIKLLQHQKVMVDTMCTTKKRELRLRW